jgi:hypothetical protein
MVQSQGLPLIYDLPENTECLYTSNGNRLDEGQNAHFSMSRGPINEEAIRTSYIARANLAIRLGLYQALVKDMTSNRDKIEGNIPLKSISALWDSVLFREGKNMAEQNRNPFNDQSYDYLMDVINGKMAANEKLTNAKIERFEDSVKYLKEHNDQFLARLEEKMDHHSIIWQEKMDHYSAVWQEKIGHHSERLDIKIGHVEELVAEVKQSNEDVKKSNTEATKWNIALVVTVILGIVAIATTMLYSNSQILLAIANMAQK